MTRPPLPQAHSLHPLGRVRWGWLASACLLAACSSTPPPPDWAVNAQGAVERSVAAYLSGQARVAALERERSRAEVARTGAPERLARLELVHCAAEVASLEMSNCPAFQALAQDAAAPERAYARYLMGQAKEADAVLLPEVHRPLLSAPADAAAARLAVVADPLSRLVAAGVLQRSGRASPAVLALAVDTASAQGWRRPLLAWLGLARQQALAAGQADEAARLQRRLDVLLSGAK